MAVETDRPTRKTWNLKNLVAVLLQRFRSVLAGRPRLPRLLRFPSVAWQIVFLNVLGLVILLIGNAYLNQFRASLTVTTVKNLETQGRIIAAAVAGAASAQSDSLFIPPDDLLELRSNDGLPVQGEDLSLLEFTIDPEQVAPVLFHLVRPTGTRARLYDKDAELLIDTETYDDPNLGTISVPSASSIPEWSVEGIWQRIVSWYLYRDLQVYEDIGNRNGKFYQEVETALAGSRTPIIRVNKKGEIVISVGVPIQRGGTVRGVLLLNTQGGAMDAVLREESYSIGMFGLIAIGVMALLSILLAQQIAGPMRRLSAAADKVRKSIKARAEIPDFTDRADEIGHLSGAIRDMTTALYRQLDSTEHFAADVAHELKNPLTSLRSAADTLSSLNKDEKKGDLIDIILHDVGRLDRLITDISDASRLDAELALVDAEPVDVELILRSVVRLLNEVHGREKIEVSLDVAPVALAGRVYKVMGHESRLAQVFNNILDNAISFSPANGKVAVTLSHLGKELEIRIEDMGPGIDPEHLEKIFVRFYTDRPGAEQFGRNSGLGLNIARQIIDAHGGRIWAENIYEKDGEAVAMGEGRSSMRIVSSENGRRGARFVITIPSA